ncbi:HGxxPAAW family protein [Arthrobacter sp. GCM10027362]|uniref:HGxxPAAW family protein n=1 Tax=Arthrobacter sp. GCM10027362 TaxID=3273379 RepID=UPI00362F5A91
MANITTSQSQRDETAADIHAEPVGHGNSPAAWTCVLIMLVGSVAAGVGFVLASNAIFWGSIGIMVIGLIVGGIMRKAGYGVGGSKLNKSGH